MRDSAENIKLWLLVLLVITLGGFFYQKKREAQQISQSRPTMKQVQEALDSKPAEGKPVEQRWKPSAPAEPIASTKSYKESEYKFNDRAGGGVVALTLKNGEKVSAWARDVHQTPCPDNLEKECALFPSGLTVEITPELSRRIHKDPRKQGPPPARFPDPKSSRAAAANKK